MFKNQYLFIYQQSEIQVKICFLGANGFDLQKYSTTGKLLLFSSPSLCKIVLVPSLDSSVHFGRWPKLLPIKGLYLGKQEVYQELPALMAY